MKVIIAGGRGIGAQAHRPAGRCWEVSPITWSPGYRGHFLASTKFQFRTDRFGYATPSVLTLVSVARARPQGALSR
jgi:hypothetical protein